MKQALTSFEGVLHVCFQVLLLVRVTTVVVIHIYNDLDVAICVVNDNLVPASIIKVL